MTRASCPSVLADASRLLEQIVGAWRTQALRTAIDIGAIDRLAEGPAQVSQLAPALGTDADGLARLLRALCALGVCAQQDCAEQFSLTQTGRLLTTGGVEGYSLRALALWWAGPMWPLWQGLDYSVRTGRSVREKLTGQANYAHLQGAGEQARTFHEAMRAMTALMASDVARLALWREATHLIDVGGGHGQLALAILKEQPHLHATVFDRGHAEPGARAQIEASGLADRCRFEAGDFFGPLPEGTDVYLLKSILHNWADEKARAIVTRCRQAARPGARLLLVERVRPERIGQSKEDEALTRADLNMLAGLGGRERTLCEFQALLKDCGFAPIAQHHTAFEFSVLEALAV